MARKDLYLTHILNHSVKVYFCGLRLADEEKNGEDRSSGC